MWFHIVLFKHRLLISAGNERKQLKCETGETIFNLKRQKVSVGMRNVSKLDTKRNSFK